MKNLGQPAPYRRPGEAGAHREHGLRRAGGRPIPFPASSALLLHQLAGAAALGRTAITACAADCGADRRDIAEMTGDYGVSATRRLDIATHGIDTFLAWRL